jgi:putative oxidoreductase
MSVPSTDAHSLGHAAPADTAGAGHDVLLLVARVLVAYIFVKSGYGKLMDMGAFSNTLASRGVPMASVLGIIGPCVEFFGGVALLLGFKTRYTGALLVLFVIVATLISHRYWEFAEPAIRRAQETNFDKNVCIIGGLLALVAASGGRFSIDGLWRR